MADPNEKAADTPEAKAPEKTPASGQQQQPVQVEVEDQGVISLYANFCRVTGTPEELIIDFALNPQPMGAPLKPPFPMESIRPGDVDSPFLATVVLVATMPSRSSLETISRVSSNCFSLRSGEILSRTGFLSGLPFLISRMLLSMASRES